MKCSEYDYYKSAKTLEEELAFVRQIIQALKEAALKAASNTDIEYYKLDDGQTVIWTQYRSAEAMYMGIKFWLQEEQRILNQLYGNRTKLQPCKTPYLRRFPRC